MLFKGLADKLKTPTGAEAKTAPVAAPAPAKVPAPAKAAPSPTKKGLFGGLAEGLKNPAPVVPAQAPAPVLTKPTLPPAQPMYGPPKPGALGNTSSLLAQPYAPKQPDLTFGSSNSTLQIPTVQQQTVVNKAVDKVVDTVDNYQKKPGAGPAAVRTVVDTVKNFDDAVMATGQTKDPVTGEEKSTVRQAIDYGRAGIAGVGLLPPFLAFNAAGQAAENLQPKKPKGAEWLNPAKVSTFVGKKTVKGAATGINKAFGAVTKFGGAGVNAAQEGYFDAYNTITKGLDRSGEGDSKPSEAALAFGNEFGGLAALVIAGKIASEGVGAVKNAKMRTVGTNEVVRSAKQVLAIEKSTNVLGQEKRVAPEMVKTNYRKLAQEVHPDKGGTAQQFQVVNQAKLILEDYNTLSGKQFRAKYQAPLVEVNKVIKQLPEKTGQAPQAPVAAKPAFQGLADQVKGKGLATTPSAPPVKAPGAPYVIPPGMKVVSVDVVPTPEQTTAFQEAGFNAFKTPEIPGPVMFEGSAPTPAPAQAPAIPAPAQVPAISSAPEGVPTISPMVDQTITPTPAEPQIPATVSPEAGVPKSSPVTPPKGIEPAPVPKAPAPAPVSRYDEIVKVQRAKLKEQTAKARNVADSHFRYQRLDQLAKQSKAEGFELAAIRRGIEGVPTVKEMQNAMKTLESNHAGKSIMIDGQVAKATGKVSFGRHQVELADGTTKYVESAKIGSAPVTSDMALAYIKENATRRLEEFAKHYGVGVAKKPTLPAPKAAEPRKPVKLNDSELHSRIMTELVNAEAGKRIAVANIDTAGYTFSAQRSTFPNWIPKELRRKPLLTSVANHLQNGTVPKGAAERRLYEIVAEEMNAQNEVINDSKFVEQERKNLYNPFASEAENAAALAKFDAEYAKLKAGEQGIAETGGGAVQEVGAGVQSEKPKAVDAPETVKAEAKPQPAPKPVEGGEVAKSKVGKSIEAKTVEKGLADAFSETAGYSKLTIKDQAEKVTDLINNDFQKARDIINGKAEVPDGIYGEYLIKAMEDYALLNGDAELALEVANSALTSATSRLAQGMRLLAERNPDSPVARLQELKKIKEEVAVKRRGKTKEKVVEEMKEAVKKTKTRHTKERWADFITEITC